MLPYSLPSSVSAFGRRQMKAYPYTPKAGDVAWVNYIPVKFVSDNYQEGTYNQKGFVAIDILSSNTGKQAWVDYVPVVIDSTRTDAWAVNSVGYIPVNFSGTGDGTAANKGLSLNFVGASTLDPRITFSRASNATVTGSNGLIQYAPHNLFTHSEQFDNSAWFKGDTTITANATVAPDGTITADKLVETATAGTHYVSQGTLTSGIAYAFSFYAKAAERTTVTITGGGFAAQGFVVRFLLTDGTIPINTGNTASIQSVGNGWYRCSVAFTASGTSGFSINLCDAAGLSNYTGVAGNGVFIWGAQLNVGSLQPYYPTTVKNLLGYSEAFDNAAWTKSNSTVSANTTVTAAPNGTFTADKLVSAASTSIQQVTEFSFSTINANSYTFSTYVKAAEYTFARIRSFEGSPFARAVFIDVNLTTGAVVRTDATGGAVLTSSSVTAVGNGWYRASMTFTIGGTGTAIAGQIVLNDGTNNFNITGNGTSGIYVWGAQLSDSASLDPYVNNPVAAPTAAAYYGARFDYDPVTLQPKGLLIEEQRTNLLTYSEDITNAIWGKANLTATSNVIVSPDGNTTADAVIENTTASQFHYMNYTVSKAASAIQYTFTAYLKNKGREVAMAFANGSNGVACRVNPATGAITGALGTFGTGWVAGSLTMTPSGNDWYRVSATFTTDATTSFVAQYSTFNTALNTNVYTGDGVSGFYVWGAQLEAGAFATSYIPTTSAQVTRSADSATIVGSNFSGWYNASAGTMYANWDIPVLGTGLSPRLFSFLGAGGTVVDELMMFVIQSSGRATTANAFTGSVNAGRIDSTTTFTNNVVYKSAYAYASNDRALSVNGVTPNTSTATYTIPTVTSAAIGSASGVNHLNGHIRSLAYYPRRLSNTELQAVTA